MAFERTGVKFVAEGIRTYLKSFSDANQAIKKHNEALKGLQEGLRGMGAKPANVGQDTIKNLRIIMAAFEDAKEKQKEYLLEITRTMEGFTTAAHLNDMIKKYGDLSDQTKILAGMTVDLADALDEAGDEKTFLQTLVSLAQAGRLVPKTVQNIIVSFVNWRKRAKDVVAGLKELSASATKPGQGIKDLVSSIKDFATALKSTMKSGLEEGEGELDEFHKGLDTLRAGFASFSAGTAQAFAVAGYAIAAFAAGAVKVIKFAFSAIKGFAGVLQGSLNIVLAPLKKFVSVLGDMLKIAGGVLIRDAIRGVISLINELQTSALKAAATFEVMEVRMQFMIAKSVRLAGVTDNVAKSFELAAPAAKGLMRWVEGIAAVAPVTTDVIINTLTFASTLGLTTDMTLELTSSILKYTTAMGLGSEMAERIIVNLVQMKRQEKITGRELTDLARGAWVPTTEILKEMATRLGIAGEEWNNFLKEVSQGKVAPEEFMQSFIDVVARDFPEAFERMSKTLQNSIVLLRSWAELVIGGRVLRPVTTEIGKMVYDLVQVLNTAENKIKASMIGEVIKKSFLSLVEPIKALMTSLRGLATAFGLPKDPIEALAKAIITVAAFMKVAIGRITEAINTITERMGKKLGETGEKAKGWGTNIVTQIAKGMAAAVHLILQVIAVIGAILSEWFKPGSPPKIAPNLDKWGAAAMTEYMQGWLKGDFSVFSEIASIIAGYIRSLRLPEGTAIPSILGNREQIAIAIKQMKEVGQVTSSMINNIVNTIPKATDVFRSYIRVVLELANAQSEVNRINSKYSKILDELNDKLSSGSQSLEDQTRLQLINDALATGRLTDAEKARLEAEKQDILIQEQIRSVEEQRDVELEASQLKVDTLTEQKEAQEALIGVQTEQNSLIKEQVSLLESLVESMNGLAGSVGDVSDAIDDMVTAFGVDTDWADEVIPEIDFDTIFGEATANMETMFDDIGKAFDPLKEDLDLIKETFSGLFGGEGGEGVSGKIDKFIASIASISISLADVATIARDFKTTMGEIGSTLNIVGLILGAIWKTALILVGSVIILIASIPAAFLAAVGEWLLQLQEGWQGIKDGFSDLWSGDGGVLESLTKIADGVLNIITAPLAGFVEQITVFKDTVIELFTLLWKELVGDSIIPDMFADILKVATDKLVEIKDIFKDLLLGEDNSVLQILNELRSSAKEVVSGFTDKIVSLVKKAAEDIVWWFNWAKDQLVDNSIIPDMMSDINKVVSKGLSQSESSVAQWASAFITEAQNVAAAMQSSAQVSASTMAQPATVTNNQTTNVTVNASYASQQSPANVRMDVEAALMSARL